ncbi:hypothetical protein [Promicromonospora soli]
MKISDRQLLLDRLFIVLAICICAELLIGGAVNIAVQGLAGPITGDHAVFMVWRTLAWVPALLYVVMVILSLPLPRAKGQAARAESSRHMRLPVVGRGALLFFGFMTLWGTWLHAASFLSEDAPAPESAALVVYVVLGGVALLLLRIVLGWLRLVPRSWRIAPEPAPGVALPEQRFAPSKDDE